MDSSLAALWPWLAMAGMGALYGLGPSASGRAPGFTALLPIAAGHAAAVALVVVAMVRGLPLPRTAAPVLAGALLLALVALHGWRRTPRAMRMPARHAGLVLGSFLISTLHGAGLMLVPALAPLCLGIGIAPAGQGAALFDSAGPLLEVLAAQAVHMAAMLAVAVAGAAAMACGVRVSRSWRAARQQGPR